MKFTSTFLPPYIILTIFFFLIYCSGFSQTNNKLHDFVFANSKIELNGDSIEYAKPVLREYLENFYTKNGTINIDNDTYLNELVSCIAVIKNKIALMVELEQGMNKSFQKLDSELSVLKNYNTKLVLDMKNMQDETFNNYQQVSFIENHCQSIYPLIKEVQDTITHQYIALAQNQNELNYKIDKLIFENQQINEKKINDEGVISGIFDETTMRGYLLLIVFLSSIGTIYLIMRLTSIWKHQASTYSLSHARQFTASNTTKQ